MSFLLYIFDDSGGIACYNDIRRDIFGDDRTGPDHHIVSNLDSRQYGRAASNPYIVTNRYGFGPFHSGVPLSCVQWMACSEDAHIWAYERVIANLDFGFVKDCEVEVGKEILTDVYVAFQ